MFTHSTNKLANDRVEYLVKSILNRRERKLREQQQTFIRRNTDENNKRDNYLLDKFTMKKTAATKENIDTPTRKLISPKKKPPVVLDDDDDFISIKKPPSKPTCPPPPKINPIKACLEAIITQIENDEATCPICNQILSNFPTIDQRERHVNQCLEESQMKTVNSSCIRTSHRSILHLDRNQTTEKFTILPEICVSDSKAKCDYIAFQMSNLRRVFHGETNLSNAFEEMFQSE